MDDNLTTPDAYAKNYGVKVEIEKLYPQYGQINVRIQHNPNQSTGLQMGLEQALELQQKLGEAILEAEYDMNAVWKFISESYGDYSPSRKDWSNKDMIWFASANHVTGPKAFLRGADKGQQ